MQIDMHEDFDNWAYTLREAGLKMGLIRYVKPVWELDLYATRSRFENWT